NRNDAFHSLKTSEHQKMLELMDARLHINVLEAKLERLEKELEETKREPSRGYQAFAHKVDPVAPPPPLRAIEWGILVRQPEVWTGAVGLVTPLAAVYAAGRFLDDGAPGRPYSLTFVPDSLVLPTADSVSQRSSALEWNAQGLRTARLGRLFRLGRSGGVTAISLPRTPWGH
ncbi:hypothetical protein MMC31_008242, partial [Peltigera leucophlebia]|nr:hypothetical protein [Peltigera leucophlebia]